jgi:hypothetical protein
MGVRPHRRADILPVQYPAPVMVARHRRLQLGRSAPDCACDGRRDIGREGHHQRAPLARALHRAARTLLYAAHLSSRPVADVLRWVLRADLSPPGLVLEDHDAHVANDVLVGIAKTDQRERSSIFSATAGVLAAYNADATRNAAANPNFDPNRFVHSTDTIYITAPAHRQALCAPLVVGLLEQIRHATYTRAATTTQHPGDPPVFFCLDEVANIAPIHDLPALVSEGGGQHLHVLVCLQDLSQARTRWGDTAAGGFLSLFQTKLILTGIADPHTLEAISLALGEYDRRLISHTLARTETRNHFLEHPTPPTETESVTYQTGRQRTLPPGDIARLPPQHGLLLRGTHWGLLRLTPWHQAQPWMAVAASNTRGTLPRCICRPGTVAPTAKSLGCSLRTSGHTAYSIGSHRMSLQDEIDQRRRDIQTEGYPMSVGELLNIYRDGDLDIHPEFQRFFRWSAAQKSRFIESLLLGIPIPSIFVHQRQDGVWDVIDGLQRLSTIFEFVGALKDSSGQIILPNVLTATDYLPSLAGVAWENGSGVTSLTSDQQRLIKRAAIDIKIVKRESDEDAKYDLFQRLNTGGSQLSDQEVRNCLLIMVNSDFYDWIKNLRDISAFKETIAISDRGLKEQYDMELAIRFLALKDADEQTLKGIGDMSDFLDTRSVEFARSDSFDSDNEGKAFTDTFDIIDTALGDEAFRRYDGGTNRFLGGFAVSAFEAITVGVHANLQAWTALEGDQRNATLRDRAKQLWSDHEFRSNSGSGIRASGRIPKTLPRGRVLFTP